jgi:hypothetical protein
MPNEPADDPSSASDAAGSGFDDGLLSDLFVNVVPIAIIAALALAFPILSPLGGGGDPLVLFHGALIAGIVLVSVVAGWAISREDAPLEGAGRRGDRDADRE